MIAEWTPNLVLLNIESQGIEMFEHNDKMEARPWGDYTLYRLQNKHGLHIDVSNLGATIVSFWVKDNQYQKRNIVLGYATPENYLRGTAYLGAVVGPWANRIRNGQFKLDGKTVRLEQNEGAHHLHGASCALHQKRWQVTAIARQGITLKTQVSKGEGGYPSDLTIMVTYRLSDHNELTIHYRTEGAEKCPINLTQHSYFNLLGGKSEIGSHVVAIDADQFWRMDDSQIPIDNVSVTGTGMDFLRPKKISQGIRSDEDDIRSTGGYDHCYLLNGHGLRSVGWVYEPKTGIVLEIMTDRAAMQFYTGNHLGRDATKAFKNHQGVCFETQSYPDQVNMEKLANDVIYDMGKPFNSTTIYKISVEAHTL